MRALTLYRLYGRKVAATLAAVVAVSVFLYGALLLGAVAHAAHRSNTEQSVRTIVGKVSELESRYLSLTKALSPERAAALGFVEPTEVATVVVGQGALTLR